MANALLETTPVDTLIVTTRDLVGLRRSAALETREPLLDRAENALHRLAFLRAPARRPQRLGQRLRDHAETFELVGIVAIVVAARSGEQQAHRPVLVFRWAISAGDSALRQAARRAMSFSI